MKYLIIIVATLTKLGFRIDYRHSSDFLQAFSPDGVATTFSMFPRNDGQWYYIVHWMTQDYGVDGFSLKANTHNVYTYDFKTAMHALCRGLNVVEKNRAYGQKLFNEYYKF